MVFLRWQSSYPAAAAGDKALQDRRQQGRVSGALLATGLPRLQMSPSQGQSIRQLLTVCVDCEARHDNVTSALSSDEYMGIWVQGLETWY